MFKDGDMDRSWAMFAQANEAKFRRLNFFWGFWEGRKCTTICGVGRVAFECMSEIG